MSADPTKLRIGCTHKVLLKVEIKNTDSWPVFLSHKINLIVITLC